MNNHQHIQNKESIIGSILRLSIPIVFANILHSAYQLTDALWVGRLGGEALAAVSVSFPITFLAISLAAGFTIAGSTLIAQYMGAKKQHMVDHVSGQTLLMVLIVSFVLGLIGFLLTPQILTWMRVEDVVFGHAQGFMQASFVGLIFVFGFSAFQALMRGIGQVTLPLYIVLGTVILNLFIDPLFIFGYGFVPAMGVMGAAVATIVTQSIAVLIGLIVLFKGKYGIHLHFKHFVPDPVFIKRAFLLGFPASIEMSTRALGMTVMTFLVAAFGTTTIAGYGIGTNILHLIIIPALGLSLATATLVGQCIGAKDIERAHNIIRYSLILGFSVLLGVGALVFLFAPVLAQIFVPGEVEVIAEATTFIRIMAFSFGFIGMQMSFIGVFRASGNMKEAMVLTLVSQWIFQLPVAYILAFHTPLAELGIWWTFPITNVVMALITWVAFKRIPWDKRNLTEEEELQETVVEEVLIEDTGKSS